MHKSKLFLFVFLLFVFVLAQAQSLSSFELNSEWIAKIESKVKNQKKVATHGKKKLLIFSLHTGYEHWTIPHTEAVMSIIAQNSGVFEVTLSRDYSVFDKNKISNLDNSYALSN